MDDMELINELIKRSEDFADRECRNYAIAELERLKSDIECKYLNTYKHSAVTVACILNDLDNRIKELKEGEPNVN